MSAPTTPQSEQLYEAVSKELRRLAECEDEIAFREAAQVRYWESMPVTVSIHRHSATALRAAAEDLAARSIGQEAFKALTP